MPGSDSASCHSRRKATPWWFSKMVLVVLLGKVSTALVAKSDPTQTDSPAFGSDRRGSVRRGSVRGRKLQLPPKAR